MSIEHSPVRAGSATGGRLLDDYCDRAQLADELDVSPRTLARYDGLREGPPRMMLAGKVFYHRELARKWLKSRLEEAAA